MPLGYSEQKKIEEHLRGLNNTCPVCSQNGWTIADDFVSPVLFDLEYKRAIEGKFIPMVALLCNNCGYVRLLAAGKVGLLE